MKRALLATLLVLTGLACDKRIHEVRLDQPPQEKLTATDVPAAPDQL
jgi:hypothetical protein